MRNWLRRFRGGQLAHRPRTRSVLRRRGSLNLGGYRLRVRFSDASEGEIDLADLVLNDKRPIVAALRDPAVFAAMRVDMDTVVWNNGFDLAPEYLRARLRPTPVA